MAPNSNEKQPDPRGPRTDESTRSHQQGKGVQAEKGDLRRGTHDHSEGKSHHRGPTANESGNPTDDAADENNSK